MNIFDVLYVFYLFSIGGAISLIFVSNMWKSMIVKYEEKEEVVEVKVKYLDKYNLDKLKSLDKKPKESNIIIENTPKNGLIIMRYSNDDEGFEYWTDSKNIPFKVLKTVARKFCLTFNTKSIYIDSDKEIEKQKKKYDKMVEKIRKLEEDEEEEELDSVFVKPKVNKDKVKKFKPIWVENKFIMRGTVKESPLSEKTNVSKGEIKVSYLDFLKIMKSD